MNYKSTSKIMFTAAAVLALAACRKEGPAPEIIYTSADSDAPMELRLTSSPDRQLPQGGTVYVWMDNTWSGDSMYSNVILTAGSDGTLTGDQAMHFLQSGNTANIYAIHGNFGTADLTNFWDTEHTHTVAQDQRTGGSGHAQSDLAFAKSMNATPAGNPTTVPLTFNSLLSTVEVVLVQGAGNPTVSKVEILNTRLEAKFTPSKTDAFSVSVSGTEGENAIQTDVSMTLNNYTEGEEILNEAFIVPQTLEKGTDFIRVTTTGGDELIYTLPDDKTFKPGEKYRYPIVVTDVDPDDTGQQGAVGDYYLSDGTVLSKETALTPELASKVIGIVFYIGHHPNDRSDYTDTGIGQAQCHGYAFALTDANNDVNDRLFWEYGPNEETNLVIGAADWPEDWSGYLNSLKFQEFIQNNEGWEMKHFPAALACETYGNRTLDQDGALTSAYDWQKPLAAPSSTSGWFIPSCGHLVHIRNNATVLSESLTKVKNSLPNNCDYKDRVKWYSTNEWYWSSNEFRNDDNYVYSMMVDTDSPQIFTYRIDYKGYRYYARAVLAF